MYFSRVELRHDMSTASLIGQLMSGNIYASHQMLWKLFPDDPVAQREGRIQGLEGDNLQSFITGQVKQWLLLRGKEKGFSVLPENVEL